VLGVGAEGSNQFNGAGGPVRPAPGANGWPATGPALAAVGFGLFAVAAGIVTSLAWVLNMPRLADWFGVGTYMQPNAAVAAACGGGAVVALAAGWRRAGLVLTLVSGVLGWATLAEHLLGVHLGIDSVLLLRSWGSANTVVPGRMGVPASSSFSALGFGMALVWLGGERRAARRVAAAMALAVSALCLLSLVGRAFNADLLYTLPRLTAVAVQTSLALLAIALGLMCCVPDVEPVRSLRGASASALLVRRSVLAIVIVPIVLGWLRLRGQEANLFDLAFGTAVRTVVEIALLLALLWWAAREVRHREEALAESERARRADAERIAAIVASSEDAIVSVTLDGTITSWNRAAERLYGYSADEAVGRNISLVIPPEEREPADAVLARIARGETVDHFVSERVARDGRRVIVSLTVSPLLDAHGNVTGASKTARDITRQHAAELALQASQERVRLATQSTGVGIWEWHIASGRILWDEQMFEIYGVERTPDGTVDYATWARAVHPEDLSANEAILRRTIDACGRGERSFRIRRYRDGQVRHVEAVETVRAGPDGRAEWMVGSNLDVTDRRLAEAALAAHRDELERRVQERTREIEAAYRRVAAADRMAAVGTMAAGLTHDMNNVLAPLSMRVSAVTAAPGLPDGVKADLVAVSRLLGHLREMSRSLSLFSRDPAQDGSVGSTDVAQWRTMVQEFLSISATGRAGHGAQSPGAIRLEWGVDGGLPPAAVAPHRLTQAVLNLVHNARDSIVEARRRDGQSGGPTPSRGRIVIAARAVSGDAALPGGGVAVSVSDDGCGMDETTRRRCIEPFYTTKDGNAGRGSTGGTGLGMALAHGIASRAGGRMEIDTALGRGTVVTLVFPVAVEAESGAAV